MTFDLLFLFFVACFIFGVAIAAFIDKNGDK